MRMTLNDIGKALRKVLSAVARAAWGILSIVTIIWTFIWLLTL